MGLTHKKVTISVPAKLLDAAERVGKRRHYSRSELMREALRFYLLPSYTPTEAELKGIEVGEREVERGQVVELEAVLEKHGIKKMEGSS